LAFWHLRLPNAAQTKEFSLSFLRRTVVNAEAPKPLLAAHRHLPICGRMAAFEETRGLVYTTRSMDVACGEGQHGIGRRGIVHEAASAGRRIAPVNQRIAGPEPLGLVLVAN
jgi:hypothetical protein